MENASSWAEFENQFSDRLVAQAIDAKFPGLKRKLETLTSDIEDLKLTRTNPFSVPAQLAPHGRGPKRTREISPLRSLPVPVEEEVSNGSQNYS